MREAPGPGDLGEDGATVLGLDNIGLRLPIAGAGSRTLAAFVDYLCIGLGMLLWSLLVLAVFSRTSPALLVALLICGWFFLEWGYFASFEIASGGHTLGKRALRLHVVSAEGGEAGSGALLIRNLVRLFDVLVGVPLMAFDPLARRLGDRLAGTLVIHQDRPWQPVVLGRTPPGWGPREVAAAEALLARAGELADPGAGQDLARRLLARVERDAPGFVAGLDFRDPLRALRLALEVPPAAREI